MVKKVLRYVSRRRIIFLRKENSDKQNNINRSFHRKVESPKMKDDYCKVPVLMFFIKFSSQFAILVNIK
jgi:hypothetical protein